MFLPVMLLLRYCSLRRGLLVVLSLSFVDDRPTTTTRSIVVQRLGSPKLKTENQIFLQVEIWQRLLGLTSTRISIFRGEHRMLFRVAMYRYIQLSRI